jgi:hypothetical protein
MWRFGQVETCVWYVSMPCDDETAAAMLRCIAAWGLVLLCQPDRPSGMLPGPCFSWCIVLCACHSLEVH